MLDYLVERGYRLTITSLKCGHSFLTTSGNVSAHSSGNAVDIAQVNGLPILGNQGRGSITEAVVRDLMMLQGTMRPSQIITLMDFGGPTFAMGDHDDHIHVGYTPLYGGRELPAVRPDPEARPVGAPDRPPRRDREPEGPGQAVRRGAAGRQGKCRRRPRSKRTAAAAPTAASRLLLPFVQLEFAGLIGLPAGRYLSRDGDREQVLIVEEFGAPRARRGRRKVKVFRGGRPRRGAGDAGSPSSTRTPLADKRAAARWMEIESRRRRLQSRADPRRHAASSTSACRRCAPRPATR